MKKLAFLLLAVFGARAAAAAPYGILLLAHGSVNAWDQDVLAVARRVDERVPVETAFGMADAQRLQTGVDRLEKRGVSRIVAVPLFVSSDSEVLDQTRYLLGLRAEPSEVFVGAMRAMGMAVSLKKVASRVPVAMTPALDDHPLVVEILRQHARALSARPAKDTLIIVGHGPYDDAANARWLAMLGAMARRIRKSEGFRAAYGATLRDDNPAPVKDRAIARLRALVARANAGGGRAVVVPDLIARGGIESHVTKALRGLDYAWDGRTILPHPNVARWVEESAAKAP